MNVTTFATVLATALIIASPVFGHHSDAGVDTESIVAFEGTVQEFAWRNPHVYVVVETEQSGEPVEWELQMGSCWRPVAWRRRKRSRPNWRPSWSGCE